MHKKYLHVLAAVLFIIIAGSCAKWFNTPAPEPPAALRNIEWDRAFSRDSGWTGGDVASSFLLPGNRVLWIFGDSFVGRVTDNRRANSALINNAIAIHPYDPARPEAAPSPEQLRFYLGPPDDRKKPASWIKPASDPGRTWYWPTGGGVVFPGRDGSHRLALFLIRLESTAVSDSIWGFRVIGSAMVIIDNPEAPASEWTRRVIELPLEIEWGQAALYESGPEGEAGYVYIYGEASAFDQRKDLVLARVTADRFEEFSAWKFYSEDGTWSPSLSRASPVATNVAAEISVDKIVDRAGIAHYLMVHSEPLLGESIFVRIADRPSGPWSEPRAIYRVPELQRNQNYFTYAAKGHAHLSAPGTLLVSYIVNSNDFNDLLTNAAIYRPRFISVELAELDVNY